MSPSSVPSNVSETAVILSTSCEMRQNLLAENAHVLLPVEVTPANPDPQLGRAGCGDFLDALHPVAGITS